jgi:hypothetical protein
VRDAFTDRELRRFCQDRPLLAPAVARFGAGWSLEDMIDVLLEYCQTQLLLPELLRGVREHNPRQYQRYELGSSLGPAEVAPPEADMRLLSAQGFLLEDSAVPGGWRVRPLAFLWWLAGELQLATAKPGAFAAWLHAQGLGSVLAPHEEQWLTTVAHNATGGGERGASSLLAAAARGD